MKISYNKLGDFIDIKESPEEISDLLTFSGLEVEHIENTGDDFIFDIGLTPNRGDATSHLGVARDLRALLNRDLKSISIPNLPHKNINSKNISKLCKRHSFVSISGIKIDKSPDWLSDFLISIGVSPKNNVIDISNYIMFLYGQPIEVFDLNKIDGEIDTYPKENVLTDNLDSYTHSILITSSYFNPDIIRANSKLLPMKSDSLWRFERGIDINGCLNYLKIATNLILDICGGHLISEINDHYPEKVDNIEIKCRRSKINRLIGVDIDRNIIEKILLNLDIKTIWNGDDNFITIVPPYRVGIEREVDIIEEILRIWGLDKLDENTPLSTNYFAIQSKPDVESMYSKVAQILVSRGYLETLTNSLVSENLSKYAPEYIDEKRSIRLINPLSSELSVMRQTMIFSSLETISFNLRRRNGNLKIFDLGKTYFKEGDSSMEKWVLSFSLCGNTHEETWQSKSKPFNLFNLREDISDILMSLGVLDLKLVPFNDETFDWGLRFMKGNVIISTIGKLSNKTKSVYSIKEEVFYGEIDWDYLTSREVKAIKFNPISKYPLVRRDLSLIIDDVVSYSDIMKVCKIGGLLKSMGVIDVYKNDKLLKGKKSYTLTFTFGDDNSTLTDSQVDFEMEKIIEIFHNRMGAEIRK